MNTKSLVRLGILVLTMMCFSSVSSASQTFYYGASAGPNSMHPYLTTPTTTISILRNIYDSLIWYNDQDYSIEPRLAERWESLDKNTWVFHLRKNVKFHNGDDFTAEDVAYSLDHCATWEKSGSKSRVRLIEKVKVIDKHTIKIITSKPYGILPGMISRIMILSKKYLEKHGPDHTTSNPVGTGPYHLTEWLKGDHITLESYDAYWGKAPEIKKVIIKPISNDATRTAALLSGEVHLINDVPVQDVERVRQNDKIDVIAKPGMRVIFYGLDATREKSPGAVGPNGENPLKDIRVRKAISMAIDVDSIIKHVMNGFATPASNLYSDAIFGYDTSLTRLPYDLEQAKALMKAAGYENGFSLTIDGPNKRYVNDSKILQATAAMLSQIGIKVKVNAKPMKTYIPTGKKGNYSFYMLGWICNPPDASLWLDRVPHSKNAELSMGDINFARYQNPQADKYIQAAAETVDANERLENMRMAQKLVLEKDVAFIPLQHQVDIYANSKAISWTPPIDQLIQFGKISWAD